MALHSDSAVQSRSFLLPTVSWLDLVEWLSGVTAGLCHLGMGNFLAREHGIAKERSRDFKAPSFLYMTRRILRLEQNGVACV